MNEQGLEEQNRVALEIAESVAPGWERRRSFVEEVTVPVREWLLRELAPQPGETVLELAAGAGDTGFDAAAAVGDDGRLISTDFSPSMVEATRRRGAERGVENVEFRVVDAQRIELEDDSVDRVLCRFGYMLMPDPARALSETRRVLRQGGRLAFTVWGPPAANPNFAVIVMTLVEAGHMPPPDPRRPSVFALADQEQLHGLVDEAGFGELRLEEVPVRFRYAGLDDYLAVTRDTAGPIAAVLKELSDSDRDAVRAKLEPGFAPFATDDGYELPGRAVCGVAS